MKTSTKIIAISIIGIILTTLFTGCGKTVQKNDPETETLRIFFQDVTTPDKGLVEQTLSELTKEKLGMKVEFVMFGPGEFSEKIPMLLASNEVMDIGFDAGWLGYVDRAKKDVYVDLTDPLKSTGKKLYDTIDPMLWKGATVNGRIYGVPTYKEIAEQWALFADEDVLVDNNIDPESINKLADAEVILAALKKDPEKAGFMIRANDLAHISLNWQYYFDNVVDYFVINRNEGKTVLNYFFTDEYKEFVNLMRDWYNKGYISKDVATRDNYSEYAKTDVYNEGVRFTSYSPLSEIHLSTSYGKKMVPLFVTPIVVTNNSTRGSMFGIYQKSKNQEKALEFLQLWNTEPSVKNLITYGIEGKHYDMVNNRAVRVKNVEKLYLNQNWATGNVFISHLQEDEPDDKYDRYKEFNSKAIEAVTLGFTPDTETINDRLTACSAVVKEYAPLLSCGVVNPDEYLPKFLTALENVGVEIIIEEIQKQFDEWIAVNSQN